MPSGQRAPARGLVSNINPASSATLAFSACAAEHGSLHLLPLGEKVPRRSGRGGWTERDACRRALILACPNPSPPRFFQPPLIRLRVAQPPSPATGEGEFTLASKTSLPSASRTFVIPGGAERSEAETWESTPCLRSRLITFQNGVLVFTSAR